MSVYHGCESRTLKYIDMNTVGRVADVLPLSPLKVGGCGEVNDAPTPISVTDLIRFVPAVTMLLCEQCINYTICRKGKHVSIRSDTKQCTTPDPTTGESVIYYEEVATINGNAITLWSELYYTTKMTVYTKRSPSHPEQISLPYELDKYHTINTPPTAKDILRLTTSSMAIRDGVRFRIKQIKHYNWLTDKAFSRLTDRMIKEIDSLSTDPMFERPVHCKFKHHILQGAVDIIVGDRLYEIKTVQEIRSEHFMQLALYAFMMKLSGDEEALGIKHYMLYNVRNDELYELDMALDELECMVKLLICNKKHPKAVSDDKTFLSNLGIQGVNIARACGRCVELGW